MAMIRAAVVRALVLTAAVAAALTPVTCLGEGSNPSPAKATTESPPKAAKPNRNTSKSDFFMAFSNESNQERGRFPTSRGRPCRARRPAARIYRRKVYGCSPSFRRPVTGVSLKVCAIDGENALSERGVSPKPGKRSFRQNAAAS